MSFSKEHLWTRLSGPVNTGGLEVSTYSPPDPIYLHIVVASQRSANRQRRIGFPFAVPRRATTSWRPTRSVVVHSGNQNQTVMLNLGAGSIG